jgi:hypothetical protein
LMLSTALLLESVTARASTATPTKRIYKPKRGIAACKGGHRRPAP